jgi:plasmid stabilization system protein ParE
MNVVFTGPAQTDLTAIEDFIGADNPGRARSFVDELIDSCIGLADKPRAYPLIPRYERHGIRRRLHGRYLIFYRIEGDMIQILHILHGTRDYARTLNLDS